MRLATENDVEGLLYYTCKLQEEVAKHFQLHQNKPDGFLRAIQLPAAATEADVQPARKRQRRGGDSTTNAFSVQQPPPQPQLVLRDYQEEAVHVVTEFLGDDGPQSAKEVKKNRIGLLDMPCGTGKTIVLASCLERLPSWCKLVICLSTTQTLTQQNLDRLAPFVSDSILVDSDTSQGATRDHDQIFQAWRRATATTTTAPFSSAAAAGERGAGSRGVLLLSSTYASARDVLTAVFAEQHPELAAQTLLVVDEAHNLQTDQPLLALCHTFPRTLLLTATPPKALRNGLVLPSLEVVHHYSMKQAIEDKWICDYRVYLPVEFVVHAIALQQRQQTGERSERSVLVVAEEEEDEEAEESEDGTEGLGGGSCSGGGASLPEEVANLFNDAGSIDPCLDAADNAELLVKKALYLANGMWKSGSRRCIAFLSTINECEAFEKVFAKVMDQFHFFPCWTASITSKDTTAAQHERVFAQRERVFAQFETLFDPAAGAGTAASSVFRLLCSVRIMDEGVDLNTCDSVFIGSVSDRSSSIRIVQRLCRANRLDATRPSKLAHCFLWADETLQSLAFLQVLRENDQVAFAQKLRCVSLDYENPATSDPFAEEEKNRGSGAMSNLAQDTFLQWCDIRAMTCDELFKLKFSRLRQWVQKEGKLPTRKDVMQVVLQSESGTTTTITPPWPIGIFWSNLKRKIKKTGGRDSPKYKELTAAAAVGEEEDLKTATGVLVFSIIKEALDSYLGNREVQLTWPQQVRNFRQWVQQAGKLPAQKDVMKDAVVVQSESGTTTTTTTQWAIGGFWNKQKTQIKRTGGRDSSTYKELTAAAAAGEEEEGLKTAKGVLVFSIIKEGIDKFLDNRDAKAIHHVGLK
jgi:superfamily II DNA or RNA helicase